MTDPLVDQMTQLRLKLIEKKLENERNIMDERAESVQSSRTYDGEMYALHGGVRRKRDLLQRLREQHMLEELRRPPPFPYYQPGPGPVVLPALLPPLHVPAQPLHIIQQQPAISQQQPTFIQQVPLQQQPPMSYQAPPPQFHQAPPPQSHQALPPQSHHGRSIKEDMVEMMLMQNAQMHQIVMQNMMLKALPPLGFPGLSTTFVCSQGPHYWPPVKSKAGAVYHHHHYGPGSAALPPLPTLGYPAWPPMMSPAAPGGQAHGAHLHLPSMHFIHAPPT
ncbi:hypothetical protein NHX12_020076 [Muraenolepis orangiensis]|uniref:DUF4587 domain-containing protein n=1 Tax=Muraenolepis orangiensis TaxID=630683 RepID=A0A9Q0EUR7_9TELE|nr:hypothetical protein NHX12_020076 [Muraenolepis orangiensis]